MKVIIEIEPENPDGDKRMKFESTENPNLVNIKIGGHYYDVPIVELYQATMPFMDERHQQLFEATQ